MLTFDAPADTTLAANTTFWLVIDIAHSPTEDFFRTAVTSEYGAGRLRHPELVDRRRRLFPGKTRRGLVAER